MTLHQRIQDDMRFCLDNAQEFTVRGTFSSTSAMRTVAALNPEATRDQFLAALVEMGYNRSTLAQQFRKSRRIDAES